MRNLIIICVLASLFMASCSTPEPLFNSSEVMLPNDKTLSQYFYPKDPVLSPGDKITISIWGHDDLSIGSVNTTFSSNEATGRWLTLDNDGEVNLPKLGRIKLAGLNLKEVNYLLEQRYSDYLNKPVITVKALNHFVNVFGEVESPGQYAIDGARLHLLDVIAEAQGLSKYAQTNQARIIRMDRGRAIELTVDLNSIRAISMYNVVLQPGDVVYISPTKDKTFDRKLQKATPLVSIAGGLALIFSIFFK